jgi:hypothetical protein
VFDVFMGMRHQWDYSFSGRVGIPYNRLKTKTDILGIELSPLFLEKFDICVDTVLAADVEAVEKKEA